MIGMSRKVFLVWTVFIVTVAATTYSWNTVDSSLCALPNDMEESPLLIKTTTTDPADKVYLDFSPRPPNGVSLHVMWNFDYTGTVNGCGGYWSKRFTNVPATADKVWAVRKTSTYISIHCNGVEVFKMVYSSFSTSCYETWSPASEYVQFNTLYDTASKMYTFAPDSVVPAVTITALADTVECIEDKKGCKLQFYVKLQSGERASKKNVKVCRWENEKTTDCEKAHNLKGRFQRSMGRSVDEDDSGEYVCVVTINDEEFTSHPVTLTVYDD